MRYLELLEENPNRTLINIQESGTVWRWHFRSLLNTARYVFYYATRMDTGGFIEEILDEYPSELYLLSSDVISEASKEAFILTLQDRLPAGQELILEYYYSSPRYLGEQLLITLSR